MPTPLTAAPVSPTALSAGALTQTPGTYPGATTYPGPTLFPGRGTALSAAVVAPNDLTEVTVT